MGFLHVLKSLLSRLSSLSYLINGTIELIRCFTGGDSGLFDLNLCRLITQLRITRLLATSFTRIRQILFSILQRGLRTLLLQQLQTVILFRCRLFLSGLFHAPLLLLILIRSLFRCVADFFLNRPARILSGLSDRSVKLCHQILDGVAKR